MSENFEDKPGSVEQLPNTQMVPQLGRRLFVFRAATVLGGVVTSALGTPSKVLAQHRLCGDPGPYGSGGGPGPRRSGGDPGFGHQDSTRGGGNDSYRHRSGGDPGFGHQDSTRGGGN